MGNGFRVRSKSVHEMSRILGHQANQPRMASMAGMAASPTSATTATANSSPPSPPVVKNATLTLANESMIYENMTRERVSSIGSKYDCLAAGCAPVDLQNVVERRLRRSAAEQKALRAVVLRRLAEREAALELTLATINAKKRAKQNSSCANDTTEQEQTTPETTAYAPVSQCDIFLLMIRLASS